MKERIIERTIDRVREELLSAYESLPENQHSSHEGYAVLLEELDELWDEIKNNKKPHTWYHQRKEAIQVAAMAIRFIVDGEIRFRN